MEGVLDRKRLFKRLGRYEQIKNKPQNTILPSDLIGKSIQRHHSINSVLNLFCKTINFGHLQVRGAMDHQTILVNYCYYILLSSNFVFFSFGYFPLSCFFNVTFLLIIRFLHVQVFPLGRFMHNIVGYLPINLSIH